jgi:RND family efflux transporter MFP subunit
MSAAFRRVAPAALLLVMGLAGCDQKSASTASAASATVALKPVRVASVAPLSATDVLTVSGSVQPRVLASLSFRVGGKILARPVQVGDHVRPGDVLARLDPADLALSLAAEEGAVAAAAADAANARADFARYDGLGRVSPAFLPSEYDRRLSALRMAEARLAQAQRQRDLARNNLAYGTLTADAEGVIAALPVEVGQVVTAGQTVATLAHADATEVVADVPESRLAAVREATSVTVTLWADPSHPLPARVREIGALADPASRTFAVKVALADPPPLLALGMTATIRFAAPATAPVALLPAAALVDDHGAPAVWVLDPVRHHAALRRIGLAAYRGDGTMAVLSGLGAGELVVTAGATEIDADMPVTAWQGAAR